MRTTVTADTPIQGKDTLCVSLSHHQGAGYSLNEEQSLLPAHAPARCVWQEQHALPIQPHPRRRNHTLILQLHALSLS